MNASRDSSSVKVLSVKDISYTVSDSDKKKEKGKERVLSQREGTRKGKVGYFYYLLRVLSSSFIFTSQFVIRFLHTWVFG